MLLVPYGTANPEAARSLLLLQDIWSGVHGLRTNEVNWAWSSEILSARNYPFGAPSLSHYLQNPHLLSSVNLSIQSLHLFPGAEYLRVMNFSQALQGKQFLKKIQLGLPLFAHQAEELIPLLIAPYEREIHEGVVPIFCAHPTADPHARALQNSLAQLLLRHNARLWVMGCEPVPVIPMENRSVLLVPLLLVAGGHWSQEDESLIYLRQLLKSNGLNIQVIHQGLSSNLALMNNWALRPFMVLKSA